MDAPRPSRALPDKPSIAVLPFDNIGGDPKEDYFSDGITEDIITELSRFPELIVIAAHSRDGDQRLQAMVITDSSDRDHARRGTEHRSLGEHD